MSTTSPIDHDDENDNNKEESSYNSVTSTQSPRLTGQEEEELIRAAVAEFDIEQDEEEEEIHHQYNSSNQDETTTGTGHSSTSRHRHSSSNRCSFDSHLAGCTVCGELPLRKARGGHLDCSQAMLWDDVAAWDWDGGLYDLITQMNGNEAATAPLLPPEVADATVEATTRHLNKLKQQLMEAGLQKEMDQKYTGESASAARIVAPFDWREIEVGRLLGMGGFSTVLEVAAFHPRNKNESSSSSSMFRRRLHPTEELSRRYLTDHCQLHPDDKDAVVATGKGKNTKKSSTKNKNTNASTVHKQKAPPQEYGIPYTRYAIKHLRNGLVTSNDPEKFKRAAVDLVLEAQLLLVLDHKNIVSIRGWAAQGPAAFASGSFQDFFVILDKLPVTLEERMWMWRTKMLKYKKRWKRRSARRRNSRQVSSWVRQRLRGQEPAAPPPPPDKYAVKLQAMFLERLQTALGIASAIAYMHSKRLIHRDLKVSNVGYDVRGDVKLFDLGLSRLLPPSKGDNPPAVLHDGYIMSRVGTKFYMSPECRRKAPYNLSADVYSFGVVLWELLSLSTPRDVYHRYKEQYQKAAERRCSRQPGVSNSSTEFAADNGSPSFATLKQEVKEGGGSWLPICPCWPDALQQLVRTTLEFEPAARPTMVEVQAELQRQVDIVADELRSLNADGHEEIAPRRRSTFRLDLTKLNGLDPDSIESTQSPTETPDQPSTTSAAAVCAR